MLVKEEKADELIKTQMKTISKLQDKIKLLEFELSEVRKEKRILKDCLERRGVEYKEELENEE